MIAAWSVIAVGVASATRVAADPGQTEISNAEAVASFKIDLVAPLVGSPARAVQTADVFDTQIETRSYPIPFRTYMLMSSSLQAGKVQEGPNGQDGLRKKTLRVYYRKGNAFKSDILADKIEKEPVDHITYCGVRTRDARAIPSRSGSYNRIRELDMVATGYSPTEGSRTGRCATGMYAGYGVVAVDPRVIPLHSLLYIEGYGYAVAGDTGGAIRRNRIDLGNNTYREAAGVGRRRVHVYVLSAR